MGKFLKIRKKKLLEKFMLLSAILAASTVITSNINVQYSYAATDEDDEEDEDITETKEYKKAEDKLEIFKNTLDDLFYDEAKDAIYDLDDCDERDDLIDDLKKYKKKMKKEEERDNSIKVADSDGISDVDYNAVAINGNPVNCWKQDVMGRWMYFDSYGRAVTGLQNIDGHEYYFSIQGLMCTGWVEDETGNWYYCNTVTENGHPFGSIAKGLYKINGKYYYFYPYNHGIMAHDVIIQGYSINSNGEVDIHNIY